MTIKMGRGDASRIVNDAIGRLINEQPELIDIDVSERALCHHLANYIREFAPRELTVDVEYNRHHELPKTLPLPPRKPKAWDLMAVTVFPDIIVHVRETDDYNNIVLEVKKPGVSAEDWDFDRKKLEAFRSVLEYEHCAHVVLGRNASGDIVRDVTWLD